MASKEKGKLSRSKSILSCETVRRSNKKSNSVCDEPVSRPVEHLSSVLVHSLDDEEFRNMLSLAAQPKYAQSTDNSTDVSLTTGRILNEMQRVAQHKQHIDDLESEERNGTVTAFINNCADIAQDRTAQDEDISDAQCDTHTKSTVIDMHELDWEHNTNNTTSTCIAYIDEDCEDKRLQRTNDGVSSYKQGNVIQEMHALNDTQQADTFIRRHHDENPFPYTWGELHIHNNKERSYEMTSLHDSATNNNHELLCGSSRVLEHNLQAAQQNYSEHFAVNYLQATQTTYLTPHPIQSQSQHNQLALSAIQPVDKCTLARQRKEKRKAKQQENVYVVQQHSVGYIGDLSPDEIVRRIEGDSAAHPPINKDMCMQQSTKRRSLKDKRNMNENKVEVYKRNDMNTPNTPQNDWLHNVVDSDVSQYMDYGHLLLDGANYRGDDEPIPNNILSTDDDFIPVKSKKKYIHINDKRDDHISTSLNPPAQHNNKRLLNSLADMIQEKSVLKNKKHTNHYDNTSSHMKTVSGSNNSLMHSNTTHDKQRSWADIAKCSPVPNGSDTACCCDSTLQGISFFYDPDEPTTTTLSYPIQQHCSSHSFNDALTHKDDMVLELEGGKTMQLPAMGMSMDRVVVNDKQHLFMIQQLSTLWTDFGHKGNAPTRYRDVIHTA